MSDRFTSSDIKDTIITTEAHNNDHNVEDSDQSVHVDSELLNVVATAAAIAKASVEQSIHDAPQTTQTLLESSTIHMNSNRNTAIMTNNDLLNTRKTAVNGIPKKRKQRINIRNRIEIKDSLNLLGFNGNRDHSDEKFKNEILRSLAKTPMVFNQSSGDDDFQENVSVYITDQRGNNANNNNNGLPAQSEKKTETPEKDNLSNSDNIDSINTVITSENAKFRSNFNFKRSHHDSSNMITDSSTDGSFPNSKNKARSNNVNLDSTRFIMMDPSKVRKSAKGESANGSDNNADEINRNGETNGKDIAQSIHYSFSSKQVSKEINMVNHEKGKMKLQGYLFKHILNSPYNQTISAHSAGPSSPSSGMSTRKSKIIKKKGKPAQESINSIKRNQLFEYLSNNNMNQSVISKFRMESNRFADDQQIHISSMSSISKSFKKPSLPTSSHSSAPSATKSSISTPPIRFSTPFMNNYDDSKIKFKSITTKANPERIEKVIPGQFILKVNSHPQSHFINSTKNTILNSYSNNNSNDSSASNAPVINGSNDSGMLTFSLSSRNKSKIPRNKSSKSNATIVPSTTTATTTTTTNNNNNNDNTNTDLSHKEIDPNLV